MKSLGTPEIWVWSAGRLGEDLSHGRNSLTLLKRLVEMRGDRIEGMGKGSEFVVRLPVFVEASVLMAAGGDEE